MSCRKYYDGLCIGGDCYRCKDNQKGQVKIAIHDGNLLLGVFLIILGVFVTMLMAVIL